MCWLLVFFSAATQDVLVGDNRGKEQTDGGGLTWRARCLTVLAGQRLLLITTS